MISVLDTLEANQLRTSKTVIRVLRIQSFQDRGSGSIVMV